MVIGIGIIQNPDIAIIHKRQKKCQSSEEIVFKETICSDHQYPSFENSKTCKGKVELKNRIW